MNIKNISPNEAKATDLKETPRRVRCKELFQGNSEVSSQFPQMMIRYKMVKKRIIPEDLGKKTLHLTKPEIEIRR